MKYNHEPNSTLLGAYREPPLVVGVAGEMHYQVLLSNQVQVGVYYASRRGFDLCILDGPSLNHLWNGCKQEKRRAASFSPFLLIAPDVKMMPTCGKALTSW